MSATYFYIQDWFSPMYSSHQSIIGPKTDSIQHRVTRNYIASNLEQGIKKSKEYTAIESESDSLLFRSLGLGSITSRFLLCSSSCCCLGSTSSSLPLCFCRRSLIIIGNLGKTSVLFKLLRDDLHVSVVHSSL